MTDDRSNPGDAGVMLNMYEVEVYGLIVAHVAAENVSQALSTLVAWRALNGYADEGAPPFQMILKRMGGILVARQEVKP